MFMLEGEIDNWYIELLNLFRYIFSHDEGRID